jgi:hypothetical protein
MRKIPIFAGLAALALAVPAQAHEHPGKGHKQHKAAKQHRTAKQHNRCQPHAVGYNARGIFVLEGSSLEQTAGLLTPERGDDRYSGPVKVNVTKANHKAPLGVQTFTLANAKVKFADADGNSVADEPKEGDRVKLHGKVTKLKRKCDQTGFTPEITVRKLQFKAPEPVTPVAPVTP